MAKAIYSLKIWIFRGQFQLTLREEKALWELVIFVLRIYVKNWISCPVAVTASLNDLILLKDLLAYSSVHQGISKAVSTKLAGHL